MKIKKAIIPAAGLGTRFLPATKAQPKEMLPIVDKPTIQFIVEEAVKSGIEEILIVTGRNKRAIEDHFDKSVELELELKKKGKENLLNLVEDISNMVDIHYIRQKEPKGLGHAIYCARTFVGNEPFAVMLGDDVIDAKEPVLKQMINVYEKFNCSILGVQEVPEDDVDKYGIIDASYIEQDIYKVNDLVEKPRKKDAPSRMGILGRYIITPRIFEILENTKPGAGGEIQLTDALKELLNFEVIYAYNFEGRRYDVGDRLGYLIATVEYALKRDDLKEEFGKYLMNLMKDYFKSVEEAAALNEKK
ncbi:MAG: UTP--glucose-phosphate uridylyltransferase [Tepidanaerobacteraceae bacterium]|nr:UTP--glucose-phosphate uridylyltransferase [Tepidanaerobacteraceae bacterium]